MKTDLNKGHGKSSIIRNYEPNPTNYFVPNCLYRSFEQCSYTSHNVKSIAEFIDIGVESTRIQSHY